MNQHISEFFRFREFSKALVNKTDSPFKSILAGGWGGGGGGGGGLQDMADAVFFTYIRAETNKISWLKEISTNMKNAEKKNHAKTY